MAKCRFDVFFGILLLDVKSCWNIEMIQKCISVLAASLRIIWDLQTGNWSRNSINDVIIAALKSDWMDGVDVGDAVGVACLVGVACSRIDDVIDVFSADDEWRARLLLLIFFRIFLRWRFFFLFQVGVDRSELTGRSGKNPWNWLHHL